MAYLRVGTISHPASMSSWPCIYLERRMDGRIRGELWLVEYPSRGNLRLWSSFDIPWPGKGISLCPEHLRLRDYYRYTVRHTNKVIWPLPWPPDGAEIDDDATPKELVEMFLREAKPPPRDHSAKGGQDETEEADDA